jgi:hypothetical protein
MWGLSDSQAAFDERTRASSRSQKNSAACKKPVVSHLKQPAVLTTRSKIGQRRSRCTQRAATSLDTTHNSKKAAAITPSRCWCLDSVAKASFCAGLCRTEPKLSYRFQTSPRRPGRRRCTLSQRPTLPCAGGPPAGCGPYAARRSSRRGGPLPSFGFTRSTLDPMVSAVAAGLHN